MATQTEILARQEQAVERLEADSARLASFMNGSVVSDVATETGNIPTIKKLIEEIRQRVGYRRYEITYSVEDLEIYKNEAEAMFRVMPTTPLFIEKELTSSFFRLATPTAQPVTLRIKIDEEQIDIQFAANETEGQAVSTSIEDDYLAVPAGTPISAWIVGNNWTARGLHLAILALVEDPVVE